MKTKFRTDVVFFLQSLGEIDDPTGIEVRDYLSQSTYLNNHQFLSFDIFDEKDFKAALLWILQSLEKKEFFYPAIQLDCHGSKEGISLKSGDIITWDRIRDFLNQLLKRTEENLLLVSGTCHGKYLFHEESPMNYIPCSVLVASRDELESHSLSERMGIFYSTLFERSNLNLAVKKMNEGFSQYGLFEVIIP